MKIDIRQRLRSLSDGFLSPSPVHARITAVRPGSLNKIALVAPDLSFAYVVVPKAANTAIKRVLWKLQGVTSSGDENVLHSGPGPYRGLAELSGDELKQVTTGNSTFRFTFVRNPYARLISAYHDKIRDVHRRHGHAYAKKLGLRPGASFEQFALAVSHEPDWQSDWHWMSQSRCALVDIMNFDFIGKVETFANDMRQVLDNIAPGFHPDLLHERANFSPDIDFPARYDTRIAAHVYRRYQRDFELFGYDRDSWKSL